jgi:hypothetical protein
MCAGGGKENKFKKKKGKVKAKRKQSMPGLLL